MGELIMRISKLIVMGSAVSLTVACGQTGQSPKQWVTIDREAAQALRTNFPDTAKLVSNLHDTSVLELDSEGAGEVSEFMHENFHRCGGYFSFDNERDAVDFGTQQELAPAAIPSITYTIDQNTVIRPLLDKLEPEKITSMITKMTSFNNRYYTATTGVDSQNWLKAKWEEVGAGRTDFSVELVTHERWPQPSVVATIVGTEFPNEIVVIGGHGDSISGQFDRQAARAPGADDNASGIATITESMRVLIDSGWHPKRTIKFMSYAAEEVGLKGSKEIAQSFASAGRQVIGVMQFDMTAFNGANTIGLMRDYSNDTLSEFTIKLIETYVNYAWMNDKCGYACSDHASWTAAGFPAVMPFESTFDADNKKIHTAQDTLANADGTGAHSTKFAKLALAYLVEVSK
jgi:leucyl aminopeptidase